MIGMNNHESRKKIDWILISSLKPASPKLTIVIEKIGFVFSLVIIKIISSTCTNNAKQLNKLRYYDDDYTSREMLPSGSHENGSKWPHPDQPKKEC